MNILPQTPPIPTKLSPRCLSLCMATMNRADFIGETLASIAAQENLDGVELIMIDGSRDDATERVLAEWRDRLPPVHYERRKPAGFDRDYCLTVERAAGEYCWLISDDDPWNPGAITAVKRALAAEPDFIVVNGEMWGPDLTKKLETTMMPIAEDRVFRSGDDDPLATVALSFLSYVGAVVVRREFWRSRRAEPYFGTDFVHVGVLLQRPIERSVVVVAQSCVKLRFGLALWKGRTFDIWMYQWPELVWSFPQISAETKRSVTFEKRWLRVRQLLLMRATGHYGLRHYGQMVTDRGLSGRRRIAARLIVALPIFFVSWMARVYFSCRGRYRGRLAWELENLPAGEK